MTATRDLPFLGLNGAVLKVVQLGVLSPGSYKSAWFLPLKGPTDAAAVQAAVDDLVARHEALRATIDVPAECERVHAVGPSTVEVVDLRGTPGASAAAKESAEAFLALPADPSSLPTLRCRAIRIEEDEWLLALNSPTWFVDGWSTCIISAELLAALEGREAPKFLDRAPAAYSETLTDDARSAPLGEVVARTEALPRQDVRRMDGLTRRLSRLTRAQAWLFWKAVLASVRPIVARLLQALAPVVAFVRKRLDGRSARRPAVPAAGAGGTPVQRIVGELAPGTASMLRRFATAHHCTLTSVCVAAMLQTISAGLGRQDAYVLNVFGRRSPKTFGTVGSLADADWVELSGSQADADLGTIAPAVSKQIMTARGIARSGGRIAAKTITAEQQGMLRAGFERLFHPWELFVVIETSPGVATNFPMAGMTLEDWADARSEPAGASGGDEAARPPTHGRRSDVRVSSPRRAESAHLGLIRLVPHLIHISFDVTEDDAVRADLHYDSDRFEEDGMAALLTACLGRLADTSRSATAEHAAP